MYKKIIIVVLLISPLFFIFIGYPVKNSYPKSVQSLSVSQRCYTLGNTIEFLHCFQHSKRDSGFSLIQQTIEKVSDLQNGMGYLLVATVLLQILLVPLIV